MTGDDMVKVPHLQVSDPDMDHPGRGLREEDPVGKVRVLADDGQLSLLGVIPDLPIGPAIAEIPLMQILLAPPEGKVVGKLYVDQVLDRPTPSS
jgi:hypothetical protein